MGVFVGENFYVVSILNKELDEEKEKTLKIQNEKEPLQETLNHQIEKLKAQHSTEIQGLKDQISQLTNQKDIAEDEAIKQTAEVVNLKAQLEDNK